MIQKVKENGIFIQWMPLLDQLFAENLQASQWLCQYLTQNPTLLSDILYESANGEVREQFCNLLKTVLKVTSRSGQEGVQMVEGMRALLVNKKGNNPKKYDEYFELLKEFLNSNPQQAVATLTVRLFEF